MLEEQAALFKKLIDFHGIKNHPESPKEKDNEIVEDGEESPWKVKMSARGSAIEEDDQNQQKEEEKKEEEAPDKDSEVKKEEEKKVEESLPKKEEPVKEKEEPKKQE